MPQMGKLYLGDIDVTYMFMGEQCVYELVQETGGTASVTFNFLNSSLACPIAIMTTDGTLITTLTTAPYTYTATGGDRIKWSAATATGGNYYKAEGSLTLIGTKTQNIDMAPYYTVTFNWITPSTGFSNVSSSEAAWYVSGATRYKSGSSISWYASADGYTPDDGMFSLSGNSVIRVELTPSGYDFKPLTFKILTAGTITWRATSTSETISYSTNKGTTWTNVTAGPSAQLGTFSAGQEVWVKGVNTSYETDTFGGTAYFNLEGNLASLINGDSFSATTPSITTNRVFFNLFSGSNVVSATNMIIPFGSVPASGYAGMFKNCTAMTLVPACRTSELSNGCYESMFEGCTSIQTALPLPTRTLAQGCYRNMFKGCTSLITVGGLSASTLQANCYYGMFSGCTSLSATPLTSASTMANSACTYMFAGCSSLTSINMPKATTLSQDCYRGMFAECTSLTTPPTLSATTLGVRCYAEMFRDCSNLTSVPTLSVTALTTGCYESMFEGCTKITTAPALPATTLAEECYSYMFYGCTALTSAPQLMAATLVDGCYEYMFTNCNRLTELWVYATSNASVTANTENWVNGITTSGTLHVPQGMSSTWPTGASRRPVNWTVSEPTVSYTETFYVYPSSQGWGNTPTFEVNGYAVYLYGRETIGGKLYDVYKYTAPAGTILNWSLYNVSLGQPQGGSLTLVGNNPTYITHKVQYAITSVTPSNSTIKLNNVTTSSTIVDYSSAVTWVVSANTYGYRVLSGTTYVTANTNVSVVLPSRCDVTFVVRDNNSNRISGALVNVNEEDEGHTDSTGEITFTAYSGDTLNYTVTKTGFVDYDSAVTVTGNIQTVNVTMQPTVSYSYSITTTQSGCTVVINSVTKTTSSSAGGTYTYTSQTPGNVTYSVAKSGWDTETGTLTTNQAKTVTLWGDYQIFVDPYVGLDLNIGVSSDDSDIIGPITKGVGGEDNDRWVCTVPYQALRPATIDFTQNGYSTESFTLNASTSIGDGAENVVTLTPVGPDYSKQYLTFEVVSAGTITFKLNSGGATYRKTIEYSSDNGSTWSSVTSTTGGVSLGTWSAGTKILIRGNNARYTQAQSTYYNTRYNCFGGTARIKMYGNIMSLVSGASYESATGTLATYAFVYLFNNFTGITDAGNLVLPALLSNRCYYGMFNGCTYLTTAPSVLPATTLTTYCYYRMFYGCFNLTAAPDLPAPTLTDSCYYQMFYGCTSLNYIKCLATNISATNSHSDWVNSVASSGTFVKASSITESTWGRGTSGIPNNWTVQSA